MMQTNIMQYINMLQTWSCDEWEADRRRVRHTFIGFELIFEHERREKRELTGYTETNGPVNYEKKKGRNRERPAGNDHDSVDLDTKLNTHGRAVEDSSLALDAWHPSMREKAGQEASDHATNAVHAESVQSVVVPEPLLELEAEEDDGCADNAHAESCCLVNVAWGGRDQDETGDCTAVVLREKHQSGSATWSQGGNKCLGDHKQNGVSVALRVLKQRTAEWTRPAWST